MSIALDRVSPQSQVLLIEAAEDGRVPDRLAIDRLSALWVAAASVNLADDLADGDCSYLEPRVGPGVSFLLQALATTLAARGEVSVRGIEELGLALARAAAGQSLEVRTSQWSLAKYREVAELIAGEQYRGYLRLLWDGTPWEEKAAEIGRALGVVGIAVTDITSADRRFRSMPAADREQLLAVCRQLLGTLEASALPCLRGFVALATATLASAAAA